MHKNLVLRMGTTPQRRSIPPLVDLVRTGTIDPAQVLTHTKPLMHVLDAYKAFDTRQPGWVKVDLTPQTSRPPRGPHDPCDGAEDDIQP